MRNKSQLTCCFTGHRDLPVNQMMRIRIAVRRQVETLLKQGVIYYGVGGAIGFDTLAAEVLMELREQYPQLKVILVYPFDGYQSKWTSAQKLKHQSLLPRYDTIVCVSSIPGRDAYLERDRHLVNSSAHCIAYCTRNYGGTAYTVRYAERCGCAIYNVAAQLQF